jgi:hypothetical protein
MILPVMPYGVPRNPEVIKNLVDDEIPKRIVSIVQDPLLEYQKSRIPIRAEELRKSYWFVIPAFFCLWTVVFDEMIPYWSQIAFATMGVALAHCGPRKIVGEFLGDAVAKKVPTKVSQVYSIPLYGLVGWMVGSTFFLSKIAFGFLVGNYCIRKMEEDDDTKRQETKKDRKVFIQAVLKNCMHSFNALPKKEEEKKEKQKGFLESVRDYDTESISVFFDAIMESILRSPTVAGWENLPQFLMPYRNEIERLQRKFRLLSPQEKLRFSLIEESREEKKKQEEITLFSLTILPSSQIRSEAKKLLGSINVLQGGKEKLLWEIFSECAEELLPKEKR